MLTLLREKQWLTALGALFGVFVMVQLLVFVLTGLEGMQAMLRNRTDLQLEIHASATDSEVQLFYSALTRLPYVQDADFITKEKAYEQTRSTDPKLIGFLEQYRMQNPFGDTISVSLTTLNDYSSFAAFIERPEWKSVINPTYLSEITDQEQQVFSLLAITRAGRLLTIIILALTVVALVFITTELVRRRAIARSDEVLVERLAGAQPLSIALPFITEAAVLLLISIILSSAVMVIFIAILPLIIPAFQTQGALGPLQAEITPLLRTMLPMLILTEMAIAPLIAVCGAWLGIRPQVESPRISFAV
ncbi:MAG: hypothetical protein HOE29_02070 [Candidatus Peribacter sp.]|nr:hypothetical protein [Candidatus Peribacter sp.]MBT4393216.1 hypothetical protein [Candidatus Peribacter sp.]MBT4601111.1 hypothetical protein [Candidatus Peribacter sp.]MBT6823435.1 hypothetical protein [Candidatus Peribacter sp.]MBT7761962.1 hypothetical protein [Candidatus Peribacter sp.]